jgi:hypothetical protein
MKASLKLLLAYIGKYALAEQISYKNCQRRYCISIWPKETVSRERESRLK